MKLAHTSGDTLEAIRWRPIVQPAALMRTWLALQRHERVEHAQSKALLGLHVRTLRACQAEIACDALIGSTCLLSCDWLRGRV
jgi:hypothetical protein